MKKIPMLEKFAAQSLVESDGELIFSKEKFAELIVAECIKLNGKELAMPGHSRMVDVYCEHFGIEL